MVDRALTGHPWVKREHDREHPTGARIHRVGMTLPPADGSARDGHEPGARHQTNPELGAGNQTNPGNRLESMVWLRRSRAEAGLGRGFAASAAPSAMSAARDPPRGRPAYAVAGASPAGKTPGAPLRRLGLGRRARARQLVGGQRLLLQELLRQALQLAAAGAQDLERPLIGRARCARAPRRRSRARCPR